jgi:hypothetical protein
VPPHVAAGGKADTGAAVRLFRLAAVASLLVSTLLFLLWSRRWPLVGDASLIHYIAFLTERGLAPYRDLGDMNMPGSFLIEMAAMHLFGMGDLAWRLFDFSLLGLAATAFAILTRPHAPGAPSMTALSSRVGGRTLPALFSACLFALIHGRDGLAEGGQRDLTMAVCLLAATACLFLGVRRQARWGFLAFGMLSGMALTIKPIAVLLTLAQLSLATYTMRQRRQPRGLPLFAATLGTALAPLIALLWLLREHALAAFLTGLRTIVPYYASLGHRPLGFLLPHSVSPLLPLVLLWIGVLFLRPTPWSSDWERLALLSGVLFGVANCVVQARGLPYYRYPVLAFLLPLMAIDFHRTLATSPLRSLRTRAAALLALAAVCFGAFVLAPQSAILIHRYRWREIDFIASLQASLTALGGTALSGRIQCIDSISGCGNVLYRMRLLPATGVLSDFLLFGTPPTDPATVPIVRATRAAFWQAIETHPPTVIVVSSHLHMDGPDDYQKLARWPEFAAFLATRYTLATDWHPNHPTRWWSREEWPAGYRIYVLNTPPPHP